jgi:sulfane dehydrogenase subunit SoxC
VPHRVRRAATRRRGRPRDAGAVGDHLPSGREAAAGPGHCEISGLAWSGRVERVEVSTDGGRSWAPAALQEPVLPVCHTRFRHPWRWDGGPAVLQSRCRDETGDV